MKGNNRCGAADELAMPALGWSETLANRRPLSATSLKLSWPSQRQLCNDSGHSPAADELTRPGRYLSVEFFALIEMSSWSRRCCRNSWRPGASAEDAVLEWLLLAPAD